MLICCSTLANCTSCWVNWLVSSGSSGFWFFSCVVSSVRNVVKLPAGVVLSLALLNATPDGVLGAVPCADVTAAASDASESAMAQSSHSDVDAAAQYEQPTVAWPRTLVGGRLVV